MEPEKPPKKRTRILWCPQCGMRTLHHWVGWRHIYARWECSVCGRVIMGEPYLETRGGT